MTFVDVESIGPFGPSGVHHRLHVSRTRIRRRIIVSPRCEHSDAERVLALLARESLNCEWPGGILKHLLSNSVPLEEARVWAGLPFAHAEALLMANQWTGTWTPADVYRWQVARFAPARAALQHTLVDVVPGAS